MIDDKTLAGLMAHPATRAALVDRAMEAIMRTPYQRYPKEWVTMPRGELDALLANRRRLMLEEGL